MGDVRTDLEALLAERIVILDGAMGTAVQARRLTEEQFRGERFADHARDLGRRHRPAEPDAARRRRRRPPRVPGGRRRHRVDEHVHRHAGLAGRLRAGEHVEEINRAGAEIARRVVDEVVAETGTPRWVAGSVGPTNQTLSISPNVNDPAFRAVTFDQIREGYAEAIRGLVEGGVDLLLIETIFDTLNAKAAIAAARDVAPGRAADDLGDDHRPERPDAVRPDAGGVLDLDRARPAVQRRHQLRAGRRADAAVPGDARPRRAGLHLVLPERRAAERVRRLRRGPRDHQPHPRRVRRGGPGQHPGRVLRHDARARARHRRARPRPAAPRRARALAAGRAGRGSAASSRSSSAPTRASPSSASGRTSQVRRGSAG